jgi:hypothetical protein
VLWIWDESCVVPLLVTGEMRPHLSKTEPCARLRATPAIGLCLTLKNEHVAGEARAEGQLLGVCSAKKEHEYIAHALQTGAFTVAISNV